LDISIEFMVRSFLFNRLKRSDSTLRHLSASGGFDIRNSAVLRSLDHVFSVIRCYLNLEPENPEQVNM